MNHEPIFRTIRFPAGEANQWLMLLGRLLCTVNRDSIWGEPAKSLFLCSVSWEKHVLTEFHGAVTVFDVMLKFRQGDWYAPDVADWSAIESVKLLVKKELL